MFSEINTPFIVLGTVVLEETMLLQRQQVFQRMQRCLQ